MSKVRVTWQEHDNRGLVCQLEGEVSNGELNEVRRLIARHIKPVFGSREVIAVDGRQQLILTEVPAWLYWPQSVYRGYLATQIESHLNDAAR